MKTFWHTSEDFKTECIERRKISVQHIIFCIFFIILLAVIRYLFIIENEILIIIGGLALYHLISNIWYYNRGWIFGEEVAKIIQNIQPIEKSLTLRCLIQSDNPHHSYKQITDSNNDWDFDIEVLNSVNKINYILTCPFKFREIMLRDYLPKLYNFRGKTINFEFKNALIYIDPSNPKVIVIRFPEYGFLVGEIRYFQKIKYK